LADEGRVSFTLEEVASIVEDLMRISDELVRSGDEVDLPRLDWTPRLDFMSNGTGW
jgi:hypothetical protein